MPPRISAEGRVVAPERQGQPGDLSPAEGSGPGELLRYGSAQGLELLSGSLRFAGFDVMTAASGTEALRATSASRPDLILLDVTMPDRDGFEVMRRTRSSGRNVPVIF
jgi:DNA-binding NarL/FixJ family response regulator